MLPDISWLNRGNIGCVPSTSQFGLFKVLRGGIDTAQVTTEVVEDRVSTSLTGLDILKGDSCCRNVNRWEGLQLNLMSMPMNKLL